ncbi:hypothetical protein [Saccharothrix coeruleofusca]|uniref:Uncharacterized protein n=1 Tax=Saccharothrix coeruleofusca TaxID=33919 RepID=A0A918EE94_9PSEU|nr:hypothetical protein [Saccharothrix coeruleofusca]MBP2338110.1 hypothetical protein [Saccharothrix coeruleofusca]GGP50696.1 hypothetical protein GCM10010185_23780 [Saccharothrix coeruleofusca]
MFAIIAAVIFGLALLLDLADASLGAVVNGGTLMLAGLLCVALHLAGVGAGARSFAFRRRR